MRHWMICLMVGWSAFAVAAGEDDFAAGEKAYRAGDVVGAMPLLRRAADAGEPRAQALYGQILDISEFNEQAAAYYRRAAEQGNADGQFGLGTLYAAGEGVERDPVAARKWFELAAAQGHANAVNTLAQAALWGTPGPQDLKWLHKAAEQNYFPALDYLAKGYRGGSFGEVDLARAEQLEARMRALDPPARKAVRKK